MLTCPRYRHDIVVELKAAKPNLMPAVHAADGNHKQADAKKDIRLDKRHDCRGIWERQAFSLVSRITQNAMPPQDRKITTCWWNMQTLVATGAQYQPRGYLLETEKQTRYLYGHCAMKIANHSSSTSRGGYGFAHLHGKRELITLNELVAIVPSSYLVISCLGEVHHQYHVLIAHGRKRGWQCVNTRVSPQRYRQFFSELKLPCQNLASETRPASIVARADCER